VEVDGEDRRYVIHVPGDIKPNAPVVFEFHGGVSNPVFKVFLPADPAIIRYARSAYGESFYLVAIQGGWTLSEWNWIDSDASLEVFDKVFNIIRSGFDVDNNRIYAYGASSGAIMSWRLACYRAEIMAAITPMVGGFAYFHRTSERCPKTHSPVAVKSFAGELDSRSGAVFPTTEAIALNYNGCDQSPEVLESSETRILSYQNCGNGADVEYVLMKGRGHQYPSGYPGVLWDFMVGHPKFDGITLFSIEDIEALDYNPNAILNYVQNYNHVNIVFRNGRWIGNVVLPTPPNGVPEGRSVKIEVRSNWPTNMHLGDHLFRLKRGSSVELIVAEGQWWHNIRSESAKLLLDTPVAIQMLERHSAAALLHHLKSYEKVEIRLENGQWTGNIVLPAEGVPESRVVEIKVESNRETRVHIGDDEPVELNRGDLMVATFARGNWEYDISVEIKN